MKLQKITLLVTLAFVLLSLMPLASLAKEKKTALSTKNVENITQLDALPASNALPHLNLLPKQSSRANFYWSNLVDKPGPINNGPVIGIACYVACRHYGGTVSQCAALCAVVFIIGPESAP